MVKIEKSVIRPTYAEWVDIYSEDKEITFRRKQSLVGGMINVETIKPLAIYQKAVEENIEVSEKDMPDINISHDMFRLKGFNSMTQAKKYIAVMKNPDIKDIEVFIDGEFAKKYSPNPQHQKGADQVSMKFAELKKASQNYYADGSTNLSTSETSGTDNSFVSSIKKMTRTINASKAELVLKKEQAGTEQAVKHLEIACIQWSAEFNKVKQSAMTPEQKARLNK